MNNKQRPLPSIVWIVMIVALSSCGSVKEITRINVGKNQQKDADKNVGCFTALDCGEPSAVYQIQGSSSTPNFRTAQPYFASAFKLSNSETPLLNQIDGQVWDNLPTYSSADTSGTSQMIALFQMAAAGCSDFLTKGQNQSDSIAGLSLSQTPSSISDSTWNGYVQLLAKRLWGEPSLTAAESEAIGTLKSQAISQNPNNTRKVAYLICISIASAPKALLQ